MKFISNGLVLGGIYCFKIISSKQYHLPNDKINWKYPFNIYDVSEDKYDIINRKKFVFGDDQKWVSPDLNLSLNLKLTIEVGGEEYKNLNVNIYISFYFQGFATILFWVESIKDELNYDEIIQLLKLVTSKNTQPTHAESNLKVKLRGKQEVFSSFSALLNDIQKNLTKLLNVKKAIDLNEGRIYPITYIKEVVGCKDAEEILIKYSKEVIGICDAWKYYAKNFKKKEIDRILQTDLHPFDYAVSIYSSAGMLELHAENFPATVADAGLVLEDEHYAEQTFLFIIAEVSILHMYVMTWYDKQLVRVSLNSFKLSINFFAFGRNLNKITQLHNSTIECLSLFKDARFSSKSYIPYAIDRFDETLGIDKLTESIKDKLNDVKQQLTIAYSIVTTIFVIILTIIGLLFSAYQIYISLNDKKLIEISKTRSKTPPSSPQIPNDKNLFFQKSNSLKNKKITKK